MKHKNPAGSSAEKANLSQAAPLTKPMGNSLDAVWAVLFSVMLLLGMTVQTGRMSAVLLFAAVALTLGRGGFVTLRGRCSVPMLGFLALAVILGCAAIYSHFGDYAVAEYQKFLPAFALGVFVLARATEGNVRKMLWGMAAVCGLIGFLCVDAEDGGAVFTAFNAVVEALGGSFSSVEFTTASRITGIYNDANVSASILALGALLSLYLANTACVLWKRALACWLLGLSAMAFFLSVSRGAMLCFALALLVWLLAAGKGRRLPLFFRMVCAAVVVMALSLPAMARLHSGSWVPDALTAVSGLVIFALDWAVVQRLARALAGRTKALGIAGAVLAVAVVGYAAAAMTVTGAYTLGGSGQMARTLTLAPGTYALSGDWDGSLTAQVVAQSKTDLLSREGAGTMLYYGDLKDTSFTVTGEEFRLSLVVYGEQGAQIRNITLSDGTSLKLGYPLLPVFVADRLQDSLRTSNSLLQRLQFFSDGWKLFGRAPVFGSGLGSTEGLLTSVQSYYYESKYVHNHLLQFLDDTGVVGLAAFLTLALGSAWTLLRRVRKEHCGLAAVLLGCLVMMNTHSLMEINFSTRAYQCLAYPLLVLPAALWAKPLTAKAGKVCGAVAACLLWGYSAVFGGLFLAHRSAVRTLQNGIPTDSADVFLSTCQNLAGRDVFDHEYAQMMYVANAVNLDNSKYNGVMAKYVKSLRASGTYTACSDLCRYYYLPRGEWEELFACSREGIAQEASNADVWNYQLDFYRTEVLPAIGAGDAETYLSGVLALRDYLNDYSRGRLEEIRLSEENREFLQTVSELDGQSTAYAQLMERYPAPQAAE